MLKITKGLKPYIEDGISTYTDAKGNQYVRVKMGDKDFGIAAHDYNREGRDVFKWDDAMKSLKADRLTTFTIEQAEVCNEYQKDINKKFEEISGEALKKKWYWTITEIDVQRAWAYCVNNPHKFETIKSVFFRLRPIINL